MSTAMYTPGPWTRYDYRIFKVNERNHIERWIAFTAQNAQTRTAESEANAILITAAPDLLTACKAALNDRMFTDWPDVATILKNAIAKAEGK